MEQVENTLEEKRQMHAARVENVKRNFLAKHFGITRSVGYLVALGFTPEDAAAEVKHWQGRE